MVAKKKAAPLPLTQPVQPEQDMHPRMLRKVAVQDFQAIKGIDLDLAPFTVIVGRGDAGKSALLRAIRAALFNDGVDDNIRHGSSDMGVMITFGDGTELAWVKPRGKGAQYSIGEQVYTKLASSVPDEVAALGFREIEVDNNLRIAPQFHDQFDEPLLIGPMWTGSKVARVLGTLTKLSAVVNAQMICKRNGDRLSRAAVTAEEERTRLQQQRTEMPDVTYLLTKVDTIDADIESAREQAAITVRAKDLVTRYNEHIPEPDFSDIHDRLSVAGSTIASLDAVVGVTRKYQQASDAVSASDTRLAAARETLVQATEEYEKLRTAAGVCEACPFVG